MILLGLRQRLQAAASATRTYLAAGEMGTAPPVHNSLPLLLGDQRAKLRKCTFDQRGRHQTRPGSLYNLFINESCPV